MISVIFRYFDENGAEKISIGSYLFFKQKMKTAKQLVEWLGWEHSEERRDKLNVLEQQALYDILTATIASDVLHTFHPN